MILPDIGNTHLYFSTVSGLVQRKILLPEVPLSTLRAAKGPLASMPPAEGDALVAILSTIF